MLLKGMVPATDYMAVFYDGLDDTDGPKLLYKRVIAWAGVQHGSDAFPEYRGLVIWHGLPTEAETIDQHCGYCIESAATGADKEACIRQALKMASAEKKRRAA